MRLFGPKYYELSLHHDYVNHWGLVDASREIIQNALDASRSDPTRLFCWDVMQTIDDSYSMQITTMNFVLEPEMLLLGKTSKGNSTDTIGKFGEGFKLAMLVLTRLGHAPVIITGNKMWTPEIRPSKTFKGCSTLQFREDTLKGENGSNTTFYINNLTKAMVDLIKRVSLNMDDPGKKITVSRGDILLERPGKLYVGGLYICDTKTQFGYNFEPAYIKLERDRRTVDSFDLHYNTSLMWIYACSDDRDPEESKQAAEIVAQMMHDEIDDVRYISSSDTSSRAQLTEACYNKFVQAAGEGAIIVQDQEEMEKLRAKGHRKMYLSRSSSFYSAVRSYSGYVGTQDEPITYDDPETVLLNWLDKAQKERWITSAGVDDLTALIEQEGSHWYDTRNN